MGVVKVIFFKDEEHCPVKAWLDELPKVEFMRTKKTDNAIEILRREREKDPELQELYEEEKIKYQIALAIRELREESGLTQEDLAKRIGTSQSTIARLEDTDYEGYSLQTLQRIADALKCRLVVRLEPMVSAA